MLREPEAKEDQEKIPEPAEEPENIEGQDLSREEDPEEIEWEEAEEEPENEETSEEPEESEDPDRPGSANGSNAGEQTGQDGGEQNSQREEPVKGPEEAGAPGIEVCPEPAMLTIPAEVPETVQIPVVNASSAESEQTETIEQTETEEQLRIKRKLAVKKTVAVAAAVTGCLGGVAGIYAGLVYLFAMAEVDTICIDGRKKRLGRKSIRSEKGSSYSIELGRDILERCETDRICIRMSSAFVRFHKNRSLIVKAREKCLSGYIKREVYLTLPE